MIFMVRRCGALIGLFLCIVVFALPAFAQSASQSTPSTQAAAPLPPPAPAPSPLPPPLVYGILIVVYALTFIGIIGAINALARRPAAPGERGWRLSDALSEEGDITGPGGGKQTVMLASSSRLIALLGMIVIMALFLGVGTVVIWDLAESNTTPALDGILRYFLAGAGLFIPYSINQIRSGFESIGKS
jgi:hypothetical protein